jgi:hypothetical protein
VVKQFMYRHGQTARFPEVSGFQISGQSAQESGKVVSFTNWPHLPPRKYSWNLSLFEAESHPRAIVRPDLFCQRKIPMIPSGIEPATNCATACPTDKLIVT